MKPPSPTSSKMVSPTSCHLLGSAEAARAVLCCGEGQRCSQQESNWGGADEFSRENEAKEWQEKISENHPWKSCVDSSVYFGPFFFVASGISSRWGLTTIFGVVEASNRVLVDAGSQQIFGQGVPSFYLH